MLKTDEVQRFLRFEHNVTIFDFYSAAGHQHLPEQQQTTIGMSTQHMQV
jgi:hypothetical protein